MNEQQFQIILFLLAAALTKKICKVYHLTEDSATCSLYGSQLYAYLEDESTKVWQYSADKLFDLYQQEIATGHIDLPEC